MRTSRVGCTSGARAAGKYGIFYYGIYVRCEAADAVLCSGPIIIIDENFLNHVDEKEVRRKVCDHN